MSVWVSQNERASLTAAARGRTAYLAPLLPTVVATIERYYRDEPGGEDVTREVLRAVGAEQLRSVAAAVSFDRAKQDLGVLVALTLVDLFGASRVETLRRADRRASSARRAIGPGLDWVGSYAPHRISPASSPAARIFLDTCTVRKIVHGDADALDLGRLAGLKGGHAVSIADGAVPELAAQLLRGSVPLAAWTARIGALDAVLDAQFPVAPGGRELAALWGGHTLAGYDPGEARAYYRAAWAYLRDAKSKADLTRASTFHAPSGRAYGLKLDQAHVERVLADAGTGWTRWVTRVAKLIAEERGNGRRIDERYLRELCIANLGMAMGITDVLKLELVAHVLAKRAIEAAKPNSPYRPKGRHNDALDLDMLFALPVPGWVCTADRRLHRLVRSTTCSARVDVMTAAELLERLRNE